MTRPRRPHAGTGRAVRRADRSQRQHDSVREVASWVIDRTLASLAPADTFLQGTLDRFDERDRGLLKELVYGTLRWLRRLDAVIERASDRSIDRIDEALLSPLRVAVYQLLFLDRIPAHAAVNEAVAQARRFTHRGGASFTNAVLRRIARSPRLEAWPVDEADPVRRLAIEWSHPDFLVDGWLACFGLDRTRTILDANNRSKPLHLLAFKDRGGRELLAEELIDGEVEVVPSRLSRLGLEVRSGDPFSSPAFARGDFYVQDEASQAAALVPLPRPGERILDAAAAPGGKTFSLLAREPSVRPVAADISAARLAILTENLRRLGRRVPVVEADATRPPFAEGVFDRVVLDLPCTGTGTLGKHPELKWRLSGDEIGRLERQALAMLSAAVPLVAPGGLLVAVTCSLEAAENERVVERLLADGVPFEPLDLADRVDPALASSVRAPGLARIFPTPSHDGFTVQVLERR